MINQANTPKRPEIPAKDFAETMGVEPSAVLGFDPAIFGQAANNGQMLLELAPRAAISEGVRRLAEVLTGRDARHIDGDGEIAASILSFLKSRKQA